MDRFVKTTVIAPLMVATVIYPGGHAAIICKDGERPLVATAYGRPIHLTQPGGRNLENVVGFDEITVSSSGHASTATAILSKSAFKT
jgi:hypothetical protein